MFTGIIQELGIVDRAVRQGGGIDLTLRSTVVGCGASIGDSISVNGVCLTVTHVESDTFRVLAVEETARRTTIGRLRRGDRVNLEPALQPVDRLGGHFVTGHIDGVGTLRSRLAKESSIIFSVEVPRELFPYFVIKGSVAMDGVSLTVLDLLDSRVLISVIPHTAAVTTWGFRRVGDGVNVEVDILGKYVEKFVTGKKGYLHEDWLKEMGY